MKYPKDILIKTLIGIVKNEGPEEDEENDENQGWAKFAFLMSSIEAIRPGINAEGKYEDTVLYLTSGEKYIIKYEYEALLLKWEQYLKENGIFK